MRVENKYVVNLFINEDQVGYPLNSTDILVTDPAFPLLEFNTKHCPSENHFENSKINTLILGIKQTIICTKLKRMQIILYFQIKYMA